MNTLTSIYQDIAKRTAGDIYIGVVGPARTGKSTFIKRFMEQLVLPNIENVYERERATDELPQQLVKAAPYAITLLVMALASQNLRMPKADGLIYRKGGH